MLHAFLLLIGLQLLGEALAATLRLPAPGMILGLLLLLALLAWRARRHGAERAIPPDLDALAKALHGHFGLLFVPAGAGILAQADLIAREGSAILAAVLASTVLTIALTARLALGRRRTRASAAPGDAAPSPGGSAR